MLHIDNLHAYYGKSHVLHGVSFNVQPGEIVALLGRNGSGRSTTAKAVKGKSIGMAKPLWEKSHLKLHTWVWATSLKTGIFSLSSRFIKT